MKLCLCVRVSGRHRKPILPPRGSTLLVQSSLNHRQRPDFQSSLQSKQKLIAITSLKKVPAVVAQAGSIRSENSVHRLKSQLHLHHNHFHLPTIFRSIHHPQSDFQISNVASPRTQLLGETSPTSASSPSYTVRALRLIPQTSLHLTHPS